MRDWSIREDARHDTLVIAEEEDTERNENTREVAIKNGSAHVLPSSRTALGDPIQQGLAGKAMDGAGSSRHDGADTAFSTRGLPWGDVGDLDGLLVNQAGRRVGALMAALWRRVLDADLLMMLQRPARGMGEQLFLYLMRQLDAKRVSVVGELVANVTGVGPGRLGAGGGGGGMTAVVGAVALAVGGGQQ